MTLEAEADRELMVQAGDFGSVWRAPLGTFQALFDNETIEILPDASPSRAGVSITQPILQCRSADVHRLGIEVGATLIDTAGARFRVKAPIAHDGTGMCRLSLTS